MDLRLSYSKLNTYKLCGKRYYYKYIKKMPERAGSALYFGSAVDEGFNKLLEGKGYDEALSAFERVFGQSIAKDMLYSKKDSQIDVLTSEDVRFLKQFIPELDRYLNKSLLAQKIFIESLDRDLQDLIAWLSLYNKGVAFLKRYESEIMPLLKEVVSVQYKIDTTGDGYSFVGIVDFIAKMSGKVLKNYIDCDENRDYCILFDNKTTSAAYKADSVETSEQLGIYSEFFEIDYCGYITFNKFFKRNGEFAVQVIIGTVDPNIKDHTFGEIDYVANKIKNNVFDINTKSCYTFGRQCDFYEQCRGESEES